jgi:hypothetical protein
MKTISNDNSNNRIVRKMLSKSSEYRGSILELSANLESLMEMVITYYFTKGDKKRSDELKECFLSTQQAMFNTKRNILCFLINTLNREEREQTRREKIKIRLFDKYDKIDENLQKISAIRNICAHRKLRVLIEDINNFDGETVYLIGTEKQNPTLLNPKNVKKELTRIKETTLLIEDFYKKIVFVNQRV